jgi:CubicO group peptidase (beta-lactamase class C family)
VVIEGADSPNHDGFLSPTLKMVLLTPLVSAACLLAPGTVARRILGPMDPAPSDLASSNSVVHAAWKNITAELNTLAGDPIEGLGNYTFSIGLFSMHDEAAQAAYQYHHTGPDVAQSSLGVTSVDGDSIYRVASITKLMTALVGNLRLNASEWNRPLTDIFPEIAELPVDDPLEQVEWEQITPLALVNQVTGLVQNGYPFAADYDPSVGLTPCTSVRGDCTALDYITGLHQLHRPSFRPWTAPQYSNTNFVLLGLVLTRLTGQSLEELYQDAIFKPLGMAQSTAVSPPDDGVFGGHVVAGMAENFKAVGGITSSSGGVFSTTNDLARLGVGILNGTLLGAAETRRWMRPTSLTASPGFAVGAGWEIYRHTDAATGAVTDLYTKQGNSGNYSGYEVLVPDYDAGFSLLLASGLAPSIPALVEAQIIVADVVAKHVLPALRHQAAAEAARRFAGTYASAAGDAALTLVYNDTETPGFGLTIASFEIKGADMLEEVYKVSFGATQVVLQPAIQNDGQPARRLSFQATAVLSLPPDAEEGGLFSTLLTEHAEWVDQPASQGQNVRTLEFDLGPDGRATAVTVPVLDVKLERVDE